MSKNQTSIVTLSVVAFGWVLQSCGPDASSGESEPASIDAVAQAFTVPQAHGGFSVDITRVRNQTGLPPTGIVNITACSEQQIYAVASDLALYYSNDAGRSFRRLTHDALGTEIACDRSALASIDASGQVTWVFTGGNGLLHADGDFDGWLPRRRWRSASTAFRAARASFTG